MLSPRSAIRDYRTRRHWTVEPRNEKTGTDGSDDELYRRKSPIVAADHTDSRDGGLYLSHPVDVVVERLGVLREQRHDEIRRVIPEVVDEGGDAVGIDRLQRVE